MKSMQVARQTGTTTDVNIPIVSVNNKFCSNVLSNKCYDETHEVRLHTN